MVQPLHLMQGLCGIHIVKLCRPIDGSTCCRTIAGKSTTAVFWALTLSFTKESSLQGPHFLV